LSEIENADIEWLADGTPYSRQFDDIYYSSHGGPEESEYVYVRGNDLETRWREYQRADRPFVIAELGFGTGLNFLLCWQLLDRLAITGLSLHYVAFEKHPLSVADLRKAQSPWTQLEQFSSQLQQQVTDHTAGLHRFLFGANLTLDLYFGEALEGVSALFTESTLGVDCWFMDGFSPARNAALWDDAITDTMWLYSEPGATASTYSVAGRVRRSLQKAGFTINRLPGFGSKREMLLARKQHIDRHNDDKTVIDSEHRAAWFRIGNGRVQPQQAVIVGAGLAGCSTAHSLARKGWHVTLIESAAEIAAGASGNSQGILQPRLSIEASLQAQFYLHALLYANRQYHQLQQSYEIGWHADGVIRLPDRDRDSLSKLLQNPNRFYDRRVLTTLSSTQASNLAGLPLTSGALFIPHGGWLRPAALCQAYLDSIRSSQLEFIPGQTVIALSRENNLWHVLSDSGTAVSAPVVILCNSYLLTSFAQTRFVPVIPVRGQLTAAASNLHSEKLIRPVVAGKYICPAKDGLHSIGASYKNESTDTAIRAVDNSENIASIGKAFSEVEQISLTAVSARASVRCNAEDYFPVIGAVPDYDDFTAVFGALSRKADTRMEQPARYHPGLYINSAHGSYGLASCPLAGEYLASLISCESLPMATAMADCLSPARFIIRGLKKQRIKTGNERVSSRIT
jgi:tRNA 5-methylaminomethyl-2-thiouridine biosynthesis bifunctional protein